VEDGRKRALKKGGKENKREPKTGKEELRVCETREKKI